jgi:hypothetical protein
MSRKLPTTPRSRVKNALRALWLRSRERAAAIRREHNTCQRCGAKGSVAKGREVSIQVHHRDGIGNWETVVDAVFRGILVDPLRLDVLCRECHSETHEVSCRNRRRCR